MLIIRRLPPLSIMLLLGTSLTGVAHADPYAFASNQITALSLTTLANVLLLPTSTATTSLTDAALFGSLPTSGFQDAGVVGVPLQLQQAYTGPGAVPPAVYTPEGPPGTFTGTRADANFGAGSLLTINGVDVSNVAEGSGHSLGNSTAINNAAVQFQIIGAGVPLELTFTDLYELDVSTSKIALQSASAAIQNTFTVSVENGFQIAEYSPQQINRQIGSAAGVPLSLSVGPATFAGDFITPVLTAGTNYVVSFTTSASETIQPGTAQVVSEPAAMGVFAIAVGCLGVVVRGRSSTRQA